MTELTIQIDAIDPGALLDEQAEIWIRPTGIIGGAGGAHTLELRGEREPLCAFIEKHWGEEELQAILGGLIEGAEALASEEAQA